MSMIPKSPTVGQIEPQSLVQNPWNVNSMSPANEEKLDVSIGRLGMFKPVVVRELDDGTLQILGGEHRAASAVRLGLKKIPYVSLGEISDKKAKEISLLDNARFGADDVLQLAELMEGLGGAEELSTFMPFSDADFASIFSSVNIALDDLDIPDEDEVPMTPREKPLQTHVVMRFRIPVNDAKWVEELINSTIKHQKLIESDSLTNVGDALIHILNSVRHG